MEEAKKMVDSLAAMTTTLLLGEAERLAAIEGKRVKEYVRLMLPKKGELRDTGMAVLARAIKQSMTKDPPAAGIVGVLAMSAFFRALGERMKELEEEAPQQEAPVSPAAAPSDRPLVGGEREHLEGEEEEEERGSAIADEQK